MIEKFKLAAFIATVLLTVFCVIGLTIAGIVTLFVNGNPMWAGFVFLLVIWIGIFIAAMVEQV